MLPRKRVPSEIIFRDKILVTMHPLPFDADELVHALLAISRTEHVSILDSCGVSHLGSHLMIAGIRPVRQVEIFDDVDATVKLLNEIVAGDLAAIFTLSYDFGLALQNLKSVHPNRQKSPEPFLSIACFDTLVVHDYDTNKSFITGNENNFESIIEMIKSQISNFKFEISNETTQLSSNFSHEAYLRAVEEVKELIRDGLTYQTNITRQISAELPTDLASETIFAKLRRDHPAPFAAFIKRSDSTVISASPERFFRCEPDASPRVSKGDKAEDAKIALADARACVAESRRIRTSPIKGTRPRGKSPEEDEQLRLELENSQKDRSENTMIVDLLRNDIGRVCEYGSVTVEKLCEIEEHPSLFHLVSTVSGQLRAEMRFSDVLKSLFPCGSITGAPKISTMKIIDRIEPTPRGLSMGAIGCFIPEGFGLEPMIDLSVAIRTLVIKDGVGKFNVGGGIVIDSDPESEYGETETKAKALLDAIGSTKTQARA